MRRESMSYPGSCTLFRQSGRGVHQVFAGVATWKGSRLCPERERGELRGDRWQRADLISAHRIEVFGTARTNLQVRACSGPPEQYPRLTALILIFALCVSQHHEVDLVPSKARPIERYTKIEEFLSSKCTVGRCMCTRVACGRYNLPVRSCLKRHHSPRGSCPLHPILSLCSSYPSP